MDADSAVQELLDMTECGDKSVHPVDRVHAALLKTVLVTESGIAMEKHLQLSDYGLCSDSTVAMVKRRATVGRYMCWVTVDISCMISSCGQEKFTLEITDR